MEPSLVSVVSIQVCCCVQKPTRIELSFVWIGVDFVVVCKFVVCIIYMYIVMDGQEANLDGTESRVCGIHVRFCVHVQVSLDWVSTELVLTLLRTSTEIELSPV